MIKLLTAIREANSYRQIRRMTAGAETQHRRNLITIRVRAKAHVWCRKDYGREYDIALDDFGSRYFDFCFQKYDAAREEENGGIQNPVTPNQRQTKLTEYLKVV